MSNCGPATRLGVAPRHNPPLIEIAPKQRRYSTGPIGSIYRIYRVEGQTFFRSLSTLHCLDLRSRTMSSSPTCTIARSGLKASISSAKIGSGTNFTSTVHLEPVLSADKLSVGNMKFSPGARTNWHWHDGGQLLRVIAGHGWVCDKGQEPKLIGAGDVIWCPSGTTHWHGVDEGCYMVHQAVSHGSVEWYGKVEDEGYGTAKE